MRTMGALVNHEMLHERSRSAVFAIMLFVADGDAKRIPLRRRI